MSKNKKTIGIFVLALLVVTAVTILATGTTTSKTQSSSAQPVFYRLATDDENSLKQMVLSDSRIRDIIKDKSYSFEVNGQIIQGQDWNLAVGAILKDDVTAEEFNKWLDEGRTDKSIIDRYVGVLSIGYNDYYNLEMNIDGAKLSTLSGPYSKNEVRIPELTKEEREKAVKIALDDLRVQELLVGKGYVVTPNKVGIWHSTKDRIKIGAALEIKLDKTYSIDYIWPFAEYNEEKYNSFPYYQTQTQSRVCDVKALIILVDFNKGSIASIAPISFDSDD